MHESFDNSRQAIRVDFECDLIVCDGRAHVAFPFEHLFWVVVYVVIIIRSSGIKNPHVRVRVDGASDCSTTKRRRRPKKPAVSDDVVRAHDERHLRRVEVERDRKVPIHAQLFERREEAVEPGETELGERPAELHVVFLVWLSKR